VSAAEERVVSVFREAGATDEELEFVRKAMALWRAGTLNSEETYFYLMGLARELLIPLTPRQVGDIREALGLPRSTKSAPTVPPDLNKRLEALEKKVGRLEKTVRRRPGEASAILPKVKLRYDEEGHPYWGPSEECVYVLRNILDIWAVKWLTSCPKCRYRLPGGALSPTEFVEHLIRVENAIPPPYWDWFRRLARMMEKAERTRPVDCLKNRA